MSKNTKTNAARILDQKKIEYEIIPYIVDENEIIEQQMEAARKLEEEAAKKAQEEKEAGGN